MRLPEGTQRFLRRTAVVDQVSGPLCDALLGEPGGQEQLRELEASSSFLIPLDRRREWYRYHALFREFLLSELHRVEPDMIMKLHLRAADWYESNGSPALALEHLLQTTETRSLHPSVDGVVLADLPGRPDVDCRALAFHDRRRRHREHIRRWQWPPVGWRRWTGRPRTAERWLATVETASFDRTLPDGSASFESARAMLRALMCPAGPRSSGGRCRSRRWRPSRRGAHGATRHSEWPVRRTSWRETSTGRSSCSRKRSKRQPGTASTDNFVVSRVRARPAGHGSGGLVRGRRASGTGARRNRRTSDARLSGLPDRLCRCRRGWPSIVVT